MQKISVFNQVEYDPITDLFFPSTPTPYVAKYLKGVIRNIEKFDAEIYEPTKKMMNLFDLSGRINHLDILRYYFINSTPFSYKEAFEITDNSFRALVFGSINVVEMISNLGNERIKVEGKNVTHRKYKLDGSYTLVNYDVIYELHKIDCSDLGINTPNYCVKCWCTSTNKEHWLWVEEKYALLGPLEAIASTVRVYENMIPHIIHIKRQGDVLLFEMDEKVIPSGNIIPLTAEQYFSKLIAQT